jgi:hypothetical protein
MKSALAALTSLGLLLTFPIAAAAGAPTKTVPTVLPFTVPDVCPFVLDVSFPVQHASNIEFDYPDGTVKIIGTGHLVATFANDTTKSRSLRISVARPVLYFHPDGSAKLIFLGKQGGPVGGIFALGGGRIVFDIAADGTAMVSQVGHFVDLCKISPERSDSPDAVRLFIGPAGVDRLRVSPGQVKVQEVDRRPPLRAARGDEAASPGGRPTPRARPATSRVVA